MTPEEREEMQRHFGVLTEDVHSQLRMVAEGNAMTTEAVQRLSEKVDAFRADFDGSRLETAREFAAVRGRLDGLDGRLDGLDGRMDGLDGRMDRLDGRMDGLDGRMDGLDGRMDGLDGFRKETARNFADLRAEIRSSYKDTDRRLKTVEARHASRR